MTTARPASARECGYLHPRTLAYCRAAAALAIGSKGACAKHTAQVLKWATEDYTRRITVQPSHEFECGPTNA